MLAKPRSRADEKTENAREIGRQQRALWALVARRDRFQCRACHGPADPNAMDMLKRGHRHHVRFRSAGGRDESTNLAMLCARCHADVHAHRLTITGNADSTLVCSRNGRTWDSPVP